MPTIYTFSKYSIFAYFSFTMRNFKKQVSFHSSKMTFLTKSKSLNRTYSNRPTMKKEGVNDISEFGVSQEYRSLVENAVKYKQDFFINNSTIEHAKFLTLTLINNAKKYIKIFTGDLSELYYNNSTIIKALQTKLQENIKVEIVTKNGINSKQFMELKEKYKELLIIRKLDNDTKINNHFLLVDGTSFRVEYPHKKEDTNKDSFNVYAKANFYNQELGGHIGGIFDSLRDVSTPI